MKMLRSIFLIAAVALASCEKDNYDGPTAGLSGRFIDAGTKQLVEQDIISGTQIELIEHGYDPVSPQFLVVKNDGTYENSLLFENMYTVTPVRGNFIDIESQDIRIAGNTTLDFTVTPYIRVLEPSITKSGNIVTATFKLQQNVSTNIRKIGLYVHSDSRVGEPMRLVAAEQDINAVSDPNHVYSITLDVSAYSSQLPAGRKYYFRAGAVVDISQAKLNYAPVVAIDL